MVDIHNHPIKSEPYLNRRKSVERIKSLGNGLIIILLFLGTAVVAVIWPLIAQSLNFSGVGSLFGGATRPATSPAPIVIPLPEPVASTVGMSELILEGFAAFTALFVIVVSSVIIAGIIITVLMRLGDKFTAQVIDSEDYQAHVATLAEKEKEKTNAIRGKQPDPNKPDGYIYGLDPVSYSLVILFFVAVFAILVYSLVSATGEIVVFGQIFYSFVPILVVLFVITIPLLAWRVRRRRLDAIAEKDNNPAPWDFVAVLILGLSVVGLGIGLMLVLNPPA